MKRTSMSKCQINRHTNCRFSVIRTRTVIKVFPRCCFQVKCRPQHNINGRFLCYFQSGSARTRNCNEKNHLNIRLSIHFQSAERLFVQFCRFWLWRDVLIDITMISRQDVWQCVMYANHFHAAYVACGGWRCVVHIHISIMTHLYQQTFIGSTSICIGGVFSCCFHVSSNAVSLGCRMMSRMPV